MGYQLSNRLTLSIYIEDVELPTEGLISVASLHIGSSIKMKVPMLSLVLNDTTYALDKLPLIRDATRIRIMLSAGTQTQHTYNFRMFNYKRQPQAAFVTWTFDGYFDNPLWWAGTSLRNYRGSSNTVLEEMAGICQINYQGKSTADARTWQQQGMRYSNFAKYVAERGYSSDMSRMTLGFDLSNTLIYKDVAEDVQPEITLSNKQFTEGHLPLVDYRPHAVSGHANRSIGYSSPFYRQSLTAPSSVENLDLIPNSNNMQLNQEVKDAIGKGQARFSVIDVGNSDFAERAIFQNTRLGALFSQHVQLMANMMPLNIKLLDWVNTSLVLDSGALDEANSGKYLITARAILIVGTTFTEKLLGQRHGTNDKE